MLPPALFFHPCWEHLKPFVQAFALGFDAMPRGVSSRARNGRFEFASAMACAHMAVALFLPRGGEVPMLLMFH